MTGYGGNIVDKAGINVRLSYLQDTRQGTRLTRLNALARDGFWLKLLINHDHVCQRKIADVRRCHRVG